MGTLQPGLKTHKLTPALLTFLVLFGNLRPVFTQTTLIEGDVYIEGIFSVQDDVGGQCGDVIVTSLQHIEAVRWTIELLNNASYLQNGKIGFRVHKTCSSVTKALDIAYNITRQIGEKSSDILAVFGPEDSNEAESVSRLFSSLPVDKRPLQVTFSTPHARLSDRSIYNNLFRLNPSTELQTVTITKFLMALTWTYVAVISEAGQEDVIQELENEATENGKVTCFPAVVSINVSQPKTNLKQDVMDALKDFYERDIKINGLIVFGGERLVQSVLEAMSHLLNQLNLHYEVPVTLLVESHPLAVDLAKYSDVSEGFYRASPHLNKLSSFDSHWKEFVDNKWYQTEPFNNLVDCSSANCTGVAEKRSDQSVFVWFAVQGTLAICNAVKEKYRSCTDISCLQGLPKNVFIQEMGSSVVDFQDLFDYTQIKEFIDPGILMTFQKGSTDASFSYRTSDSVFYNLKIYNRRRSANSDWVPGAYEEIFAYSTNADTTRKSFDDIVDYFNGTQQYYPDIRKPQCPDGAMCDTCPARNMADIVVTEGDMYIVGIVPVHTKLDDPLQCGPVKSGGFDVAEAIKFGLTVAQKDYNSTIPRGKIGSIIIDSCNDPQIISARILQLHNKGIYENGEFKEVQSKILGYVGGWVSDVSITVATILSRLGYVQISYGSTSPQLSHRDNYPYFMRVIPSDAWQGDKMVQLVKKMGSSLVQILYSDTAYGIGGMESIKNVSEKQGICVSQAVVVKQGDHVDLDEVVSQLTKPDSPKVVMVFLSSFDVVKIISRLNAMEGYIFVASEGWGNRDIIAEYRNLKGSITVAHELAIDQRFREHMNIISMQAEKGSWLTDYLQSYFDCYFEWSFDKTSKSRVCTTSDVLQPSECYRVSNKECFKIETWSPFASTAVLALLQGARKTLDALCGNSKEVCSAYHKHPETLTGYIQPLKLAYDKLSEKPLFDKNLDGLIPYSTYLIDVDEEGAFYRELPDDYTFNMSTCSLIHNAACDVCHRASLPSSTDDKDKFLAPMVVFILLFVIVCVALAVILLLVRRHRFCFRASDDTYLHPSSPHFVYATPSSVSSPCSTDDRDASDEFHAQRETHENFYLPENPNRCPSSTEF